MLPSTLQAFPVESRPFSRALFTGFCFKPHGTKQRKKAGRKAFLFA
jgi:hypothetical protein